MAEAIAVVALVVAVVAAGISALAAGISAYQLREARRANALPGAVDLFREYRSAEMVAARRLLASSLPGIKEPIPIGDLPDDIAQAALKVSHYLDNLGVLVVHELVRPELAAGFLGDSTLRLWCQLRPFIEKERQRRSPNAYQQYFEHLAATFAEVEPERVRADLKRWQGEDGT